MKNLWIVLLFLPFLSFSQINQTDANGLRQGLWKKQQPNGKPLYEGYFRDGKPVGEWKRYHEGGQVKAIIDYRSESDSAYTQLFDEGRSKIAEGYYLKEKKAGTWKYFFNNRLIADEQYNDGQKDGISHTYYDTGEKLEKIDWKGGVQDGDYQVFFKDGKSLMECKVKNNQRNGLCLTYFQNGKMELEAHYINGLRDGTWNYYKDNGDLWYTLQYAAGKILNPAVKDSIDNLQLLNLEKNKDSVIDPEKYLDDPAEYMMKKNINR